MSPILAPDIPSREPRSAALADVRDLEDAFCRETARVGLLAPKGARPGEIKDLAQALKHPERGKRTLDRVLRVWLGYVQAGLDARIIGEVVADVLGAFGAAVLPVREASLAELVAECYANPRQHRAEREDATLAEVEEALTSLRAHRRALDGLIASFVRRRSALLNRERVA